jgi:hypothetical protein
MTGIEGEPMPAEIDFEPGAEIHRVGRRRDADIAEIARAVAGWNVHAPAQRYCEVREVAAHAGPVGITTMCRPWRIGALVVRRAAALRKAPLYDGDLG